jgi:hypothetical protein
MRWYIPAAEFYPIVVIVELRGLLFSEIPYVETWKSPLTNPEVGKSTGVIWIVHKPPFVFQYNLDAVYKVRVSYHQ